MRATRLAAQPGKTGQACTPTAAAHQQPLLPPHARRHRPRARKQTGAHQDSKCGTSVLGEEPKIPDRRLMKATRRLETMFEPPSTGRPHQRVRDPTSAPCRLPGCRKLHPRCMLCWVRKQMDMKKYSTKWACQCAKGRSGSKSS